MKELLISAYAKLRKFEIEMYNAGLQLTNKTFDLGHFAVLDAICMSYGLTGNDKARDTVFVLLDDGDEPLEELDRLLTALAASDCKDNVPALTPGARASVGRYRKIPVEVEAVQFTGGNLHEMERFVPCGKYYSDGTFSIVTLEGEMHVSVGDYVIRGVKGEFYPCKPDIFEMTYEKAEP